MDGSLFDRWTRRRFGLVGGGLAALLVRGQSGDARGKKRRKKKRCRKRLRACKPRGKRKCCGKLRCGGAEFGPAFCCKRLNASCGDSDECCPEGGTACREGTCQIV